MEFQAAVKTNPPGILKGQFKCSVTPQGIRFTQGKTLDFLLPVGTPAEHLGTNKIALTLPDYKIEMVVGKLGSYTQPIARDLTAFMQGRGYPQDAKAYAIPWYLMIIAMLPLGLVATGGAIGGGIGGALAAMCYGILQNDEWPVAGRAAGSLALVVGGYAFAFKLLW